MKRTLAWLLCTVMLLSLCTACGDQPPVEDSATITTTEEPTTSTEETTTTTEEITTTEEVTTTTEETTTTTEEATTTTEETTTTTEETTTTTGKFTTHICVSTKGTTKSTTATTKVTTTSRPNYWASVATNPSGMTTAPTTKRTTWPTTTRPSRPTLIGTTKPTTMTTSTTTTKSTTKKPVLLNNDNLPRFNGTVKVFTCYRETFYEFLENPYYSILEHESRSVSTYPDDGDRHILWGGGYYMMSEELLGLVGDKEAVAALLAQNGVDADIEGAVLMDPQQMPFTVWVKTVDGSLFVTVNEKSKEQGYHYIVYTHSEYKQKFSPQNGTLIVKNKTTTEIPITFYNGRADIPLGQTLEALGAKVKDNGNGVKTFTIDGVQYRMETSEMLFIRVEPITGNLLHLFGGVNLIYKTDNDLLVTDVVLRHVLNCLGDRYSMSFNDAVENTITIVKS